MKYIILMGLFVLIMLGGCQLKEKVTIEKNRTGEIIGWKDQSNDSANNSNDTYIFEVNTTITKPECYKVEVTLPLGVMVITQEHYEKLNYTAKLYQDLMQYIFDHDADLNKQLKEMKNGSKDRIVDPILQEKLNRLHDNLVNGYTGEEVMAFGLGGILNEVYDIDDALNPNNVTRYKIRGE